MNPEYALALYRHHSDRQARWLELHQKHCTQFLTLIAAVLAASLAAAHYFPGQTLVLAAVCLGPAVNIVLSLTAIKLCDRCYLAFLEDVTISAKLEREFGLGQRPAGNREYWSKDELFIPGRWHTDRKQHRTSEDFVRANQKRGANSYVQMTFWILLIANALVLAGLINALVAEKCVMHWLF